MAYKEKSTPKQRQLIQIRRKQAGMDHDNHVDYMKVNFGLESTTLLTRDQAAAYLKHLESLGYGGKPPEWTVPAAGAMSQDEYIHKLWQKLGDSGKLKEPGEAGLNKFIASLCKIQHLSWCDKKQKTKIIFSLRRWLNGKK